MADISDVSLDDRPKYEPPGVLRMVDMHPGKGTIQCDAPGSGDVGCFEPGNGASFCTGPGNSATGCDFPGSDGASY